MQAGLVGWEMVCLHTYPPHPGRLSRRYPIAYLLVVILLMQRLGSHFSCYPPRLVFTSQASTLCAFGLAPRRVELRAVREVGQGTCSLTTLSIKATNESPGNLRGWKGGV